MKRFLIYTTSAIMLSLSACSPDADSVLEDNVPSVPLRIEISRSDFITDGTPDTRATDNGATTTFENGDRVGVIVIEDGTLKANNLPYKYEDTNWVFDTSTATSENKSLYYYDNKATNVTYIVYYPYTANADNVAAIDGTGGLKSKFPVKDDQSTKEAYRQSDLMIWTTTPGSPLKTLTATLTHAYASVSLSQIVKWKLANDEEISYVSSRISDVNLTVGSNVGIPYQAEDGSYRYILPDGHNSDVRCFYTYNGKTYGKIISLLSAVTANTRYASTQTIDAGTYGLSDAQVGDFYCKNSSDGNGYLIPYDILSLTEPQQSACIGVVFWVGNIATESDDPLLKTSHSGCTHGLVAALHDVSTGSLWSNGGYEDITSNWLNSQIIYGITSLKTTDKMQGYANTQALAAYNLTDRATGSNSNKKVLPIDLIKTYAENHPAPTSSSSWYWPSVKELKYMCWGQSSNNGIAGKEMLNRQFAKVQGAASLQSYGYWSSTEYGYDWAWYVYFYNGDVSNYYGRKYDTSYWLRAVLAF